MAGSVIVSWGISLSKVSSMLDSRAISSATIIATSDSGAVVVGVIVSEMAGELIEVVLPKFACTLA